MVIEEDTMDEEAKVQAWINEVDGLDELIGDDVGLRDEIGRVVTDETIFEPNEGYVALNLYKRLIEIGYHKKWPDKPAVLQLLEPNELHLLGDKYKPWWSVIDFIGLGEDTSWNRAFDEMVDNEPAILPYMALANTIRYSSLYSIKIYGKSFFNVNLNPTNIEPCYKVASWLRDYFGDMQHIMSADFVLNFVDSSGIGAKKLVLASGPMVETVATITIGSLIHMVGELESYKEELTRNQIGFDAENLVKEGITILRRDYGSGNGLLANVLHNAENAGDWDMHIVFENAKAGDYLDLQNMDDYWARLNDTVLAS
jgi:hypothetical protein